MVTETYNHPHVWITPYITDEAFESIVIRWMREHNLGFVYMNKIRNRFYYEYVYEYLRELNRW